jgi:hypothetical protein
MSAARQHPQFLVTLSIAHENRFSNSGYNYRSNSCDNNDNHYECQGTMNRSQPGSTTNLPIVENNSISTTPNDKKENSFTSIPQSNPNTPENERPWYLWNDVKQWLNTSPKTKARGGVKWCDIHLWCAHTTQQCQPHEVRVASNCKSRENTNHRITPGDHNAPRQTKRKHSSSELTDINLQQHHCRGIDRNKDIRYQKRKQLNNPSTKTTHVRKETDSEDEDAGDYINEEDDEEPPRKKQTVSAPTGMNGNNVSSAPQSNPNTPEEARLWYVTKEGVKHWMNTSPQVKSKGGTKWCNQHFWCTHTTQDCVPFETCMANRRAQRRHKIT